MLFGKGEEVLSEGVLLFNTIKNHFSIFSNEVITSFINAELNPLCFISFRPAMVQPFVVVTLSISCFGR